MFLAPFTQSVDELGIAVRIKKLHDHQPVAWLSYFAEREIEKEETALMIYNFNDDAHDPPRP